MMDEGTPQTGEGLAESGRRMVLRRILVAWIFGAAWQSVTSGAVLTRTAKTLHVTEFGFGILAAIPFMAAFIQLPVSFFIEHYGHRKPVFLTANLIHRFLWLVIAALPWLVSPEHGSAGLITLMALSAVCSNATAPAWFSWLSDLVPPRIRGRYLSRRAQAGQITSLILTVLAGVVLDWAEGISGVALARMLSILLAAAAVSGLIDILLFVKIPDSGNRGHSQKPGLQDFLLTPLRNRSFRHYLGFTMALTFSTGYVSQFSWLYLFDVVHASNRQANMLLMTYPMLVVFFAVPFWGRMIDRLGRKPVAIIATACVIHGGAIWVLVREGHLMPAYLGVLVAAFAWPGVDLASYNILLGLVSERGGARRNTAYVALNSMMVAAAGTASGLLGGVLARWLKDWHGELFGLPLTYHGLLFLMSAVFRIIALVSLRSIEDPRAFSARQAVQYMAADMYSNLQNTLMMPLRLAGRWSYKLGMGKSRRP